MLPSTTNFRILQVAACRFWYYLNDPEAFPSSGRIPVELCSIAGVNQYYATMASILAWVMELEVCFVFLDYENKLMSSLQLCFVVVPPASLLLGLDESPSFWVYSSLLWLANFLSNS
jgi:hypothetical protein